MPSAPFTSARTVLGAGDTLLLYTDGLTEARTGEKRELFGDEALLDFATALTDTAPRQVVTAMTGLLNSFGDGLDDDTALLALGVPMTDPTPASDT